MSKILKLRAIINKANGQINTTIRKRDLPKRMLDDLRKDPTVAKYFKFKLEGLDL